MRITTLTTGFFLLTAAALNACGSDKQGGTGVPQSDSGADGATGSGGAGGSGGTGSGGAGGADAGTGGTGGMGASAGGMGGMDASAGGMGGTDASAGGMAGMDASSTGGTGGADARSPEQTGRACETVSDCFPNVDHDSLSGPVECLDRVEGGYCTHECDTDGDCCAVSGECQTSFRQVCAPFESAGKKYCFLSCELDDIRAALDGGADAAAYTAPDGAPLDLQATFCAVEAHESFACRSSGGGKENRKVCVPGGAPGGQPDGGVPEGGIAIDAGPDAADGSTMPDSAMDSGADGAPADAADGGG